MAGSISKSTHQCILERELRMSHMTGIRVVLHKTETQTNRHASQNQSCKLTNNSLGACLIITRGYQAEAQVGRTRQISKLDIMAERSPACQPRGIVPFWRYVTRVPNCDRSGMPSRGCEIGQPEIVVNSVWVHVGIQGMVHRVAVHLGAHADVQVPA